jgi:hypothetical protein
VYRLSHVEKGAGPHRHKVLEIPPITRSLCALVSPRGARGLSGQDPRSTLVEPPLQISLFFAKQTQFQNGQYKHKHGKNKGLCQRTANNQQRMLSKTNPIKPSPGTIRNTQYEIRTLSSRDTQYAIRDTKSTRTAAEDRAAISLCLFPPSSKTERTAHRRWFFCPNPLLIGLFPGKSPQYGVF